jgi:hypothetical protein
MRIKSCIIRTLYPRLHRIKRINEQIDRESSDSASLNKIISLPVQTPRHHVQTRDKRSRHKTYKEDVGIRVTGHRWGEVSVVIGVM